MDKKAAAAAGGAKAKEPAAAPMDLASVLAALDSSGDVDPAKTAAAEARLERILSSMRRPVEDATGFFSESLLGDESVPIKAALKALALVKRAW